MFSLTFEFGFYPLEAKNQTKWLDLENIFFSKIVVQN
jgi:hypothetical protein